MADQSASSDIVFRIANGIVAIVVGLVVACFVANVAFPVLIIIAGLFNGAPPRDPVGMIVMFLIFGAIISALPALGIMTLLVAMRVRTWWTFAAGGVANGILINCWLYGRHADSAHHLLYHTNFLLSVGLTSLAGAAGGVAAWAVLERFWSSVQTNRA